MSTKAPYSVRFLDDAGEDASFFEVLESFAALFVLLFFEKLLARDDDVAALSC